MSSPMTVFLVEDEALIVMELRDRLTAMGYVVCGQAARGEEALKQILALHPDLVLMDIKLTGEWTGIETANRLRALWDVPVVFLSAFTNSQLIGEAVRTNAFGYLVKPFEERELHATLQAAFYKHQTEQLLRADHQRLEAMVQQRTAELLESEERLAITLNSIGDGVLATDAQGRVTSLNPVAERLTGWTMTEAAGRLVEEVFQTIDAHTRQPSVIPVDAVLRSEQAVEVAKNTVLIARDGIERSIADRAAPIRDRVGNIRGMVLVFRDHTRELEAQRVVRDREQLLSSINKNLLGNFVYRLEISLAGTVTFNYVSPNVEEITGLSSAQLLADGGDFLAVVLDSDLPVLLQHFARVRQTGAQLDVEVRLMHATACSLRWLRLRGRTVECRPDGTNVCEGVAIDLTVAKEAETEIRKLALVAARTVNGVVLTDPEARIEWVNGGFTLMSGYTLDEVRGRVPGSFLQGPDSDPAARAKIRDAIAAGRATTAFTANYAKDGRKYWVEIEIQPLHDAAGNLTHFMAIEKDVTERKAAEEEMRRLNANLEDLVKQRTERLVRSEERFRLLAENMRDLLSMIDEAGLFSYVSPSFGSVLGYTVDELLGDSAVRNVHPENVAEVSAVFQGVLAGGPAQPFEFRYRHKAGYYIWVEANANAVRLTDGAISGCVVTARDISERKEAEERLLASEQHFSDLVENIHDAIIRDDVNGQITFCNRRFVEWFGLTVSEGRTVTIDDYIAPEWRSEMREKHLRRIQGEDVPDRIECEGRRVDGQLIWIDVLITSLRKGDRIVGTQSVIRDVTARKQAELAAQAVLNRTASVVGAEFYQTMAYALGETLDMDLICIARVSRPGWLQALAHYSDRRMLEPSEIELLPEHPCAQVVSRGELLHIVQGVQERHPEGICGRQDLKGYIGIPLREANRLVQGLLIVASTRPLPLDPLKLSLLHILAARTEAEFLRERSEAERTETQTRLFQSQKFEALGTLAGGVAHDFNNILTGVLNYTTLALADCPGTHPQIAEFLGEVLKCGQRAKELVRQILLFGRAEESERGPVLLQLVLKEALTLLRATIPTGVEIKTEIDRNAPVVLASSTQIHQVVMNLCINAAHAMREKGGTLTLKLWRRTIEAEQVKSLPGLRPGDHVCLVVDDTGSGMEPTILARIFEPFFTTKQVGEGSGLGLAIVHSVVRSHEGAITVRSQPGAGTTFEVFFPVHAAAAAPAITANCPLPRGQGQRLVLVDDDPAVAKSTRIILERLGYQVTAFAHPDQALAHIWADPDRVDALVSDFQMPGMTGVELGKAILRRRPSLPIFIVSGFASKMPPEKIREAGIAGFLKKPIDLAELAEALARVWRS